MFRGESNVHDWWIICTPFSPMEVKLGRAHSRHQKNPRCETKIMTKLLSLKRKKNRRGLITKQDKHCSQEETEPDEIALLVRKNWRKYVACHGVGMQ